MTCQHFATGTEWLFKWNVMQDQHFIFIYQTFQYNKSFTTKFKIIKWIASTLLIIEKNIDNLRTLCMHYHEDKELLFSHPLGGNASQAGNLES